LIKLKLLGTCATCHKRLVLPHKQLAPTA